METQFADGSESKKDRNTLNDSFIQLVSNIMDQLENEMKDNLTLSRLLSSPDTLVSKDLKSFSAPEDFTEKYVIEPTLEYLGYKKHPHKTKSASSVYKKEADYTLESHNGKNILVESEPMNKNLDLNGVGINQVSKYLEIRSFRSDLGIATDGFRWVLVIFDTQDYKPKVLTEINLKPFYQREFGRRHGQKSFGDVDSSIIEAFRRNFGKRRIDHSANSLAGILREHKRKISRNFYQDYIGYVFGESENRKRKTELCLLDTIKGAYSEEDKRLFAVSLMNRLIFIRFLEDRGLVPKNLLNRLLTQYEDTTIPNNFYTAYLKPLFYKVMNVPKAEREKKIKEISLFSDIPYLNGGLFRDVVYKEQEIDVSDDVLTYIIRDLMERYRFALSTDGEALDPDILGNVFEKTINYITGGRKEKGAYYTPDDITSFITKNTIQPYVFSRFKEALISEGWKERDVEAYPELESLLADLPKAPKTLKAMLSSIDNLTVLDPACGSGHFLTSALNEITHIRKTIHDSLDDGTDVFEIKKAIISRNIFGVDIESSAIEIAKLRLWLSLIESIDADVQGEVDTLPNIEYNIQAGNSLVGWSDSNSDVTQSMMSFGTELRNLNTAILGLKALYSDNSENMGLLREVEDLLLGSANVDVKSMRKAYLILRGLYSKEKGTKAQYLRALLEIIRKDIYDMVLPHVWSTIVPDVNKRRKGITRDADFQKCFHWGIDFGNVLSSGGFDVIIGNPPYGVKLKEWEKKFINDELGITKITSEIAFMHKAKRLVKDGGYVGMIIPKSMLFSDEWRVTRNMVLDGLLILVDVSKAFVDVKLEQVIYIQKKGDDSDTYTIASTKDDETLTVDKNLANMLDALVLYPDEDSLKLVQKLNSSGITMGDISETSRGLPVQKLVVPEGDVRIYRGDNLSRFTIGASNGYIKDPSTLNKYEKIAQPKIVSQRLVAHILNPKEHLKVISAIDREGILTLDTVENTFVKNENYSLEFLACLLNSKLAAWYLFHYVYCHAIRTMDLDNCYVRRIPVPSNVDNDAFKELVSRIESSRRIKGAKGKPEVEDCYFTELDQLIYHAYGMTEAEISIIEEDYLEPIKVQTLNDFLDDSHEEPNTGSE